MITRHWHGWTSKANAHLVDGRPGAYLLRRDLEDEVEFVVIHLFESMDTLLAIIGENYEAARLLPGAENLLSRYDPTCTHYEITDEPQRP